MSEEKNRDELKNTKENDRDQAVPEVSESENASDTDNKNSDPGAKETSSRKKSDKAVRIISDNKNAGAAFAGANADVPSGAPDIDSAVPGDDILEIIRRRKAADGNSGTAPDAASSGNEAGDMFDIEELNHEVGATVSRNTDTKIMDRKTLSGTDKKTDPEMKRTITVDPENNEAAKGEVSEDLRRTLAVEVSEDGLEVKKVRNKSASKGKASSGRKDGKKTSEPAEDTVETRDVDIEDFFYQEKPEKELTAEEKAKYENRGLDGKGSESEPGSRGLDSGKPAPEPGNKGSEKKKDNTDNKDNTDESDLLLEELTAGADGDDADDKRYGFKPYTREIRSMEIAEAAEKAAAEKEANSLRGKVKRMATKKKKPTSSASKSSGAKASGTSQKKTGSSGSGSSGKSKAARNSKTLANGKMSKNTAAYKLTDLQDKSGKKKNGGGKTRKSQKRPRRKQKKWVGFFRAFIRTIIVFVLIAVLAGTGYAAYVISHAPTIHPKNIYDTLDVSSHIYDDQENLIDEIYFSENRELATYEQLPENLKNAFIAVEDKTFWTHSGFNFRRIIGAILERFHGGRISGTSTITQQLARNVFLPEDKSVRSIKRKIIEMYYAYQIEQELSKEEIITAYLNTIYLGYGCYGVDTAAKTYFSTDVESLTLEQCAALAALPQAPGSYALLTNEPTDITTEYGNGIYINDASADRRNMILNLMLQQGMITQEEKDEATKPLEDFIEPGSSETVSSTSAFKDYLIETIKKDLMNEYGIEEEQAIKIIYTKGLNIYTTLDSQAQEVITKQFRKKENFPSVTEGDGDVEAAMVITEVGTGKIKAMVGTRKAVGQMVFNRATNPRQPGSSIKPLAVYAPALQKSMEYHDEGKIFKFEDTGYDRQGKNLWGDYLTVSSTVVDEPMEVEGREWPLNVTRTYSGTNTFKTAIQKSINTCAVKILAQIGLDYSMDTLKRFGITSVVDDTSLPVNDLNLAALGLGAMTYGISPLEMSAAYAAFPNGGVRNTTICYTKVEDSGGRTLLESQSETVKVLDEGVAWIMVKVLQSVVTDGIATPAKVEGIEVGGKTGTTDDRYDIWFCGFTPSISAALWIGTDENVQMDSYSDKASALWGEIIARVDIAYDGEYPDMPDNVFRAWDGEYYTTGTAPEKPPEPEPEKKKKKKKKKSGETEAAAEAPAAEAAAPAAEAAPASEPAPAPEAAPEG